MLFRDFLIQKFPPEVLTMSKLTTNITILNILLMWAISPVMAEQTVNKIKPKVQSYSVGLGSTRLVYDVPSDGTFISVNNPNDFPVLVQSKVFEEDKVTPASFVVTPPLFRLDSKQQNRIRIIMTEKPTAADKEILKWLCVTGIPPEGNDEWSKETDANMPKEAELQIKVRLSRCIKLIIRPQNLGKPEFNENSLTWLRTGNKLKVTNPGPYIMSPGTLKVGQHEISDIDYVPARGSREFSIPDSASGAVQWTLITDEGSSAGPFSTPLR